MNDLQVTVFTKPWKMDILSLARHISTLGFDGIELPVRPGFAVNPDNVTTELPKAVQIMRDHNLTIPSIAGPTDERTATTCAKCGIPLIRICVDFTPLETYTEGEDRIRRELAALLPILAEQGVSVGVQNHCGRSVANAGNLMSLIKDFDPKLIGAAWDAGHNGLQGEEPELAIDIVWCHLKIVNLKNAFWRRLNGPEAEVAEWSAHWTTGRNGLVSWKRVINELKRRNYNGALCLTAEYSEENAVDRLIGEDISFVRELLK